MTAGSDLAAPSAAGVGTWRMTTKRGLRCSAADAFLRPRSGGGLALRTASRSHGCCSRAAAPSGSRSSDPRAAAGSAHARSFWRPARSRHRRSFSFRASGPGADPRASGCRWSSTPGRRRRAPGPSWRRLPLPRDRAHAHQVLGRCTARCARRSALRSRGAGRSASAFNQAGGLVRSSPTCPRRSCSLLQPAQLFGGGRGQASPLRPDRWPGFALASTVAGRRAAGGRRGLARSLRCAEDRARLSG